MGTRYQTVGGDLKDKHEKEKKKTNSNNENRNNGLNKRTVVSRVNN